MTLGSLALLSVSIGVILLVAELLLPTHGLLGVLALVAFGVAIGTCFYVNQWLGLAVLAGAILASPLIGALFVKMYPRTPIGRRMVLQQTIARPEHAPIRIGQVGTVVSALRPMGECDFGDERLEVISEHGMIPPGQRVKIVSVVNGRPAVRVLTESESETTIVSG